MRIKPNTYYRTNDGNKVYILGRRQPPLSDYHFEGYTVRPSGVRDYWIYTEDGSWSKLSAPLSIKELYYK